jgi:glycosyltransferase involved in cell wall biosynthesis
MFVSASLEGGGAERQLVALANHVAKRGCEVSLMTWSGAELPDAYPLHPRVERMHLSLGSDGHPLGALRYCLAVVSRFRAALRRWRPELVVSFITSTNVLTLLATRGLGMRVVVSERVHPAADATVTRVFRSLRAVTYRFADAVVSQTESAAQWTRVKLGARAVVVPNVLRELPEGDSVRQPLVLAAGRLAPQKGFDLLLRAFAEVAPDFPGWNLVICGEGPERDLLLGHRDALGLTSRVSLPGFTADIETWLGRAAIFVLPSRFEGFPNALLEAMGMGMAVISSDCQSGPSELVRNGVNGYLVPVEDVAALARRLAELMKDAATRERLGKAALEVRELYAEQRVMERWWSILATDTRA